MSPDERLRVRALAALGPLGDALAQEVLEHAELFVERDALVWEGTQGTMHGHRVVVKVAPGLLARITGSHPARDGLGAALAAAMSERPGQAVADVRFEAGPVVPRTAYRS